MISSGVDGRKLVGTSGETVCDISSQLSSGSFRIQSLEECKLLGIGRGRLIERGKLFNNNMRMALDLTLRVQELRSGKVVRRSVDEEASLHVLNLHFNGEQGVGLDSTKVRGEGELG